MCLYPKLIKNKKYISNKKNGGIVPPLPLIEVNGRLMEDLRVLEVPVGCGRCIECKKQKARNWNVRLNEEIRNNHKHAKFITLTFSNESYKELYYATDKVKGYEKDNAIATLGVRRFLERWRKQYKKSLRHWLVTELGKTGTEHIHLHGIIWTTESNEELSLKWRYGYISIGKRRYDKGKALNNYNTGYVNEQSINYITKYIHKQDEKHPNYKAKILTSAGIGKGYTQRHDSKRNKFKKRGTDETYKNRKGYKLALPIYYRNQIYSEEEREQLWLEKLDKEERFVLGQRIDISQNDEQYYKALKEAREKNKRLGYGTDNATDDEKERKRIEQERRNLKHIQRLKNGK